MRKVLLLLALSAFSVTAYSQQELKIFFEDADSYPYSMKNKTGLDFILLEMAAKKIGVKLNYTAVPWERCLSTMQKGEADGCFSASFKDKRLENGDYPMKDGKPDESRRLHTTSYSIFVKAEDASKYSIDGFNIKGIAKDKDTIATTLGYSIGDDYKKEGYKIDDSGTKTEQNLNKVLKGRVAAFATMTQDGEYFMTKGDFAGKIVKLTPPVVEKAYYLMLSKQFVAANGELARKFWDAIGEMRESKEYKDQVTAFLTK